MRFKTRCRRYEFITIVLDRLGWPLGRHDVTFHPRGHQLREQNGINT
jgi:hypothetical protein